MSETQTTDAPAITERGFPACSCLDCQHPTPQNANTRLVHKEHHWEFKWRTQTPPTDTEIGMWVAVQMLDSLTSTEPVGIGQCIRPDHEPQGPHPAHPVNPYGTCDRAACVGLPAHAAHS